MKRFTNSQLWAFVNRADTHEKIQIADEFLDAYHATEDEYARRLMRMRSYNLL